MAITTFAELKTAAGNWLDNPAWFSDRDDEFIALFEAKLNRRLRVRQQVTSSNITPSSGSVTLPSDYLEWIRLTWTGDPMRELEYVEPSYLKAAFPTAPSDTPRFFTVEGAVIKIAPLDTTAVQLLYYAKVPALSDAATTNWLLTAHPDVYLFGTLTEAHAFNSEATQGQVWNARLEAALSEVERLSQQSRGQMQIRAYGSTP